MQKILLIVAVAIAVVLYFRGSARGQSNVAEAWEKIGKGALLIDVRSQAEFDSGHLDGSTNIVHDRTGEMAKAIGDDKSRPVVVYCRTGRRSGLALEALRQLGYTNVVNGGGYTQMLDGKPKL